MAEPIMIEEEEEEGTPGCVQDSEPSAAAMANVSRKEKRKAAKKEKRKQIRKELAEKARAEEEAWLNDPEEQRRIQMEEERENERVERERREFEERERLFLEEMERKKSEEEEEERRKSLEEESKQNQARLENESNEDDDWEYVEEGPPEIIWQGNEIIVKKKRVRVKKKESDHHIKKEDTERPTSNPLPPQSDAFADYKNASMVSAQQLLEDVAHQIPNFGTEQDKAHCPFHIKTGACRFGSRCSRAHFYPDKSCTLLFKNMYNGPGLAWEQDEGLESMDEEVEHCYEEFYEDVHTEFLKFGEIVNFKVCRNGSFHLRGNVYVHYKSLDSAVLAYHSINGRFFAGKQVKCEFVSLTRWKVAICGEYMKSRLKTCSRGTACNFIHCFRNPGGDYEWADWDKPPPKYWVRKMVALFGYAVESGYDKHMEQESSAQLRNSSNITPDRDRYYSRRSRSREMYCLNGKSSRSRHGEHDVCRSTDRRRHTSGGGKQPKTLDERSCEEEANSKNKQDGKNRTCDTDEDEVWLDRDKDVDRHHDSTRNSSRCQINVSELSYNHRGSKSRTHKNGSDGDLSDGDRDRNIHHGRTRKSSRRQKKASEIQDNFGDNNRIWGTDSSGDWSDDNNDRVRHHSYRLKSSRHRDKVSVFPDGHWDSKSRTHDSDSTGDWSDGDRERNHSRTRECSRNSNKVSGLSDDHGESDYLLNNKLHCQESDGAKIDLQGIPKRSQSSRRDRSIVKTSEAGFLDEQLKSHGNCEIKKTDGCCKRSKLNELEYSYDHDENIDKVGHLESENDIPEKNKKSRRKVISDEDVDSGSPGQYDGRGKSYDCGYYPQKNNDESSRKSSRKLSDSDRKRSREKSKLPNQISEEYCSESRSRGIRWSSHGKHPDNLDEKGSTEEVQETRESSKRHREKGRSHGHKRQKKNAK